jgi:hypothetical protein
MASVQALYRANTILEVFYCTTTLLFYFYVLKRCQIKRKETFLFWMWILIQTYNFTYLIAALIILIQGKTNETLIGIVGLFEGMLYDWIHWMFCWQYY